MTKGKRDFYHREACSSTERAEQRDEMRGMRNRLENWGHEHDLLKGNFVIAQDCPTNIWQLTWTFSKMHLRAPFSLCVFSSQTQNATFSKKLHFIPNQTGFLYLLSSKQVFWVENVETNKHLGSIWEEGMEWNKRNIFRIFFPPLV